jgi:hypothetical protein
MANRPPFATLNHFAGDLGIPRESHIPRVGITFVRGHLIDFLLLDAAGAQRTKLVWHPPDAILVGHQHVAVPPGETVRPIEIFDVALNEIGAPAAACGTQQGQIAGALLGHQHVAIREHEQPARIGKSGREWCRGETRRNLLPVVRQEERAVRYDCPGLGRREVRGIDARVVGFGRPTFPILMHLKYEQPTV